MTRITDIPSGSVSGMEHPIERARHLATVARAHADRSEQARRLAPPVVDAFIASGLARLIVPTALGGWAAPTTTMVEVVETVSAADPSTGWCVAIGLGSNFLAGYLPEGGARDLFTDLDRAGSGVFAPTGQGTVTSGGYCLSGRWAFASGCQHAAVQASGMVTVDRHGDVDRDATGAPRHRLAFVATEAVHVEETWDTVGMRGTGSHDTVVERRMVPREHTLSFDDASWADDALFQQSPFAVLGPCLGAVPLGVGRAALDAVEDQICAAHAAPKPGPKPPFGDDVMAQHELGRAEIRLRAARALLLDALDSAYQSCLAGRPVGRADMALLGLASQEAMAAAVQAVDVAARLAGTSSVRDDSRLDRLHRDINTMRHHVLFSPAVAAPLGRQLAGIDTTAWPFLLPEQTAA
jgi:alkylation response protein AidB-like acyl-CoA dehydrogenase